MSFDEETRDSPAAREAQVGLPARRAAVELLSAVIDKKQPLDDILSRSLASGWMFDLPQRDRALARAIVATSLRRRGEIDRVLDTFLERGIPDKAGKLYPILLSGAAQLLFLKTPPHAAIDLAVRLAQWDSRARRYDKLVNAVASPRKATVSSQASMRRASTRLTGYGTAGSRVTARRVRMRLPPPTSSSRRSI
jgi:transcription termination factor NusB